MFTRVYLVVATLLFIPVGGLLAWEVVGFDRCDKNCVSETLALAYRGATALVALLVLSAGACAVMAWTRTDRRRSRARTSMILAGASILSLIAWFPFAVAVGVGLTT